MESFRFIHTADLQLGASFGRFDAELAGQLKAARIEAVDRIVQLSVEEGARHVLVAGDVWDKEQPAPQTLRQPIDIMGAAESVIWWLLPGNHDPYRSNMLWARVADIAPTNVRLLTEPKPVEIEPGVFVLPAPWSSKAPGRDLTSAFDETPTPDGALRIGLAHGGVVDFSGDAPNTAAIDPERAAKAKLDYLALGDWHGVKEINARTWYAGTPEPDRFPKNEPGYALVVDIPGAGAPPTVTPKRVNAFDWRSISIDLRPGMDLDEALKPLFGDRLSSRHTLITLALSGSLSAPERLQLDEKLRAAKEKAAFLECVSERLDTLFTVDDLDSLDLGGSVRLSAEQLLEKKNASSIASEQADAARALEILFALGAHAQNDVA